MRYAHSRLIEVRQARKKGRGVFARKNIRRGTVIERVPVVVMRVQEIFSKAPRTTLADYVFSWGHGKSPSPVATGPSTITAFSPMRSITPAACRRRCSSPFATSNRTKR